MKISYSWLKDYIKGKLPRPEKLAEVLTLHAFEVGSVTKREGDYILDIDVLPNRAHDCLSHIGIARECAALTSSKFKVQSLKFKEERNLRINRFLRVEVKDKKLCPRYTARVLTGVKVKDSPKWIKRRLLACGIKPINNIVDATNYVMLETGQPLHTFDLDKIEGMKSSKFKVQSSKLQSKKSIIIRRAKRGEKITILDGSEYELDRDVLVIADVRKPLAIAGIKGGKKAEIDKGTQNIVLESANFDSLTIRKASKKLEVKSDASRRFEAGLDPNICEWALNRVASLIQRVSGGEIAKGLVDICPKKVKPIRIKLDIKKVKYLLGIEVSRRILRDTFKHLGFKIKEHKFYLEIEIPTWRRDLSIPEDLIEEIVRIYGYNKISSHMPEVTLAFPKQNVDLFWKNRIKDILISVGFTEMYNYSFMSEKDLRVYQRLDPHLSASTIKIANPMNIKQRYLRPTLISNLLVNSQRNLKYFDKFEIFELGRIYYQKGSQIQEKESLAGAIVNSKFKIQNAKLFYRAKGMIELLLNELGIDNFNFEPYTLNFKLPFWHPTRTAEIIVGRKVLGTIGEVHPELKAACDINSKVVLFELDFELLTELANTHGVYKPVSRYPSITLDLAVIIDKDFSWANIKRQALREGSKVVKGIELFDIYKGKELPKGKISFAFHVIYQVEDRTLIEKEVKLVHEKIIRALEKMGGEVRR